MDDIKYRHELKYLCDAALIEIIKKRVAPILKLDNHSTSDGYTVRSLYFDDVDNTCYFENENGTDPREKFRIRIYNANKNYISLECKRKERGKTLKSSCVITEKQYDDIVNKNAFDIRELMSSPPVLRRLLIKKQSSLFRPVVIVEYDRIPYVYKLGNVRVTLDTNIRSSSSVNSFFDECLSTRPVLSKGQHLLEVKYDEFIPDHIKTALQIDGLNHTAFSKYYLCRKFSRRGVL